MELGLPEGFATQVFVEEAPEAGLLPERDWTLMGDAAVRDFWRARGLPEPPGTMWVPVAEEGKRLAALVPWLDAWARIPLPARLHRCGRGRRRAHGHGGAGRCALHAGDRLARLAHHPPGPGGRRAWAGRPPATWRPARTWWAPSTPPRVVACRAFLGTLPERQLESGRWEIFKMALVQGDAAWARSLLAPGPPEADSLSGPWRPRPEIVHRDLKETGERRLLNLGHTLGHALETASGTGSSTARRWAWGPWRPAPWPRRRGWSPSPRTSLPSRPPGSATCASLDTPLGGLPALAPAG